MDFLATLATVVGLLVPLIAAASWLLQKGFSHQKELVQAWHSSTNEKLAKLFSEMNQIIVKVSLIERENHSQLVELKAMTKKVEEIMEGLRDTKKEMNEKLSAVERSTVTWLTDQLALIRSKKGK